MVLGAALLDPDSGLKLARWFAIRRLSDRFRTESYPAQHESIATSLSNVWAASLTPSDRVR